MILFTICCFVFVVSEKCGKIKCKTEYMNEKHKHLYWCHYIYLL